MHSLTIVILIILLQIAVWQDIRHYRIPNTVVFSGTIIGMTLHSLLPQDMGAIGILTSLAGLSVGLLILFPLYILRAMGAGDIKLMAMIGTFVGPSSILMITVYVLLAGGILALSVALLRGRFSKLMVEVPARRRNSMNFKLSMSLENLPRSNATLNAKIPPASKT